MAESDPPAAGKKKSSLMSTMIEWLVATLIAAGAGIALTAMNPGAPGDSKIDEHPTLGKLESNKKPAEKTGATAVCAPGGPSLIDLPPIVTNIANPSDLWVRLEGAIVFDPKTLANPEVVAAQIATDELAYLRNVSVAELQGPIGLQNIRQDLRERAAVRSNGKVTDLLLKTLVLQ